jgi:hypothetical protein
MLFKMFGIERAWELHMHAEDAPKLRQLFVTRSWMLAGKVEEYFSKLMKSLSTASKSPQQLIEITRAQDAAQEQEGLVDIDDTANWRNDLPTRYSLLKDEHFPLFLTFDHASYLFEPFVTVADHGKYFHSSFASSLKLTLQKILRLTKH